MSGTAKPATLRLEIRERIAFLTLARPDAANTMNLAFGREFLSAVLAIEAAPIVRAVVITGEGRNFCFGGDLKGMVASGTDIRGYLADLTTHLHAGIAVLARLDAPVIAAVNGTAAGAGLGLVLAADLAIAARSAKFAPAYTAVGLTPDASCTFLLPRAVGYKRAMELLMTNRVLDAEQALAWGLVNEVVDDAGLAEAAAALAARLSSGATGAFGALKRLMAESEPGLEAQLARESRSIAARGVAAEGKEGIAAFLEKRAPRY
ncbi:MAG TPA: enoyl-CoA hydratase/isomerase family protein [Steroidobacteraceae bacterium]|jgi:2-(1,2-epoxy-1,2-dihydrophenyl)acetyl-CoA isomerase|nr:enoyl-CoA hydratase/isomerase family protein [Steroidobacteraceae bacterium]